MSGISRATVHVRIFQTWLAWGYLKEEKRGGNNAFTLTSINRIEEVLEKKNLLFNSES
ncbi:MAG: hypothetical protein ACMUEM_06155 [Flavobacteriales bacterium AspAUS03]